MPVGAVRRAFSDHGSGCCEGARPGGLLSHPGSVAVADHDGAKLWRPLLISRVCVVAIGIMWLGMPVLVVVNPGGHPSDIGAVETVLVISLMLTIAFGFLTVAFSYIAVEKDHLVIRNFLPAPRRIPYATIRSVTSGYQGLEVRLRGRRRKIYGWAVQQANWRTWSGRPGRTEGLLRAIQEQAPDVYLPDLRT